MQVLAVEFRIKTEHIAEFDHALLENARASRESEPGCRQFDVCRDPTDPGVFFLYELYDDVAAVQAHLCTPHFLQMNEASADWVESKTVRRYSRSSP